MSAAPRSARLNPVLSMEPAPIVWPGRSHHTRYELETKPVFPKF